MPTPVRADSKKTNVSLRELRERVEVWRKRFEHIDGVIDLELKNYLSKMNGDLPTYLDLKRMVFPKLYQYGNSNLNTLYAAWVWTVSKGYHDKFRIHEEIFIAPK